MGLQTFIFIGLVVFMPRWSAVAGDPLSRWEPRLAPSPGSLEAVAYGNGLFVAVGEHGAIITSSNGADWSSQSSGVTADLVAICSANGTFVVVGSDLPNGQGHILTSTNGVSWVNHDLGFWWGGVAYGNGLFTAAGAYGIVTSTDTSTWTPQEHHSGLDLLYVASGNGETVVVGEDFEGYGFCTSSNGADWVRQDDLYPGPVLSNIGFVAGEFIAVGGDGEAIIERSRTGTNWTEEWLPISSFLHGVASGDGAIVVVGDSGAIVTSASGSPWLVQHSDESQFLRGIAYGKGSFVAVGGGTLLRDSVILQSDVTSVTLTGERSNSGTFKLTAVGGIEESHHRFQATSDLTLNDWTDLGDYSVSYSNAQGRAEFLDQAAPNFARRFYRVIVPP